MVKRVSLQIKMWAMNCNDYFSWKKCQAERTLP